MLPGPVRFQVAVPVVLAKAAVKLTGDPPAMTVALGGEMEREGVFPPPPLFPLPPPQPMARDSNASDASQRRTDMSEPFVRF
jgi:hypothetical protein